MKVGIRKLSTKELCLWVQSIVWEAIKSGIQRGFVVFLYATCNSCVRQQSVRSNGYLLQPVTRKFGITSPRHKEKILKCGRNSLRYVYALSMWIVTLGDVGFLFLFFWIYTLLSRLHSNFTGSLILQKSVTATVFLLSFHILYINIKYNLYSKFYKYTFK